MNRIAREARLSDRVASRMSMPKRTSGRPAGIQSPGVSRNKSKIEGLNLFSLTPSENQWSGEHVTEVLRKLQALRTFGFTEKADLLLAVLIKHHAPKWAYRVLLTDSRGLGFSDRALRQLANGQPAQVDKDALKRTETEQYVDVDTAEKALDALVSQYRMGFACTNDVVASARAVKASRAIDRTRQDKPDANPYGPAAEELRASPVVALRTLRGRLLIRITGKAPANGAGDFSNQLKGLKKEEISNYFIPKSKDLDRQILELSISDGLSPEDKIKDKMKRAALAKEAVALAVLSVIEDKKGKGNLTRDILGESLTDNFEKVHDKLKAWGLTELNIWSGDPLGKEWVANFDSIRKFVLENHAPKTESGKLDTKAESPVLDDLIDDWSASLAPATRDGDPAPDLAEDLCAGIERLQPGGKISVGRPISASFQMLLPVVPGLVSVGPGVREKHETMLTIRYTNGEYLIIAGQQESIDVKFAAQAGVSFFGKIASMLDKMSATGKATAQAEAVIGGGQGRGVSFVTRDPVDAQRIVRHLLNAPGVKGKAQIRTADMTDPLQWRETFGRIRVGQMLEAHGEIGVGIGVSAKAAFASRGVAYGLSAGVGVSAGIGRQKGKNTFRNAQGSSIEERFRVDSASASVSFQAEASRGIASVGIGGKAGISGMRGDGTTILRDGRGKILSGSNVEKFSGASKSRSAPFVSLGVDDGGASTVGLGVGVKRGRTVETGTMDLSGKELTGTGDTASSPAMASYQVPTARTYFVSRDLSASPGMTPGSTDFSAKWTTGVSSAVTVFTRNSPAKRKPGS